MPTGDSATRHATLSTDAARRRGSTHSNHHYTGQSIWTLRLLYIEPGSPWENGYCEGFNSKLRDEFLNGEIFYSLKELGVLAERWRVHYNTVRPHSSLGYRPPAPAAWMTEAS